jgi:hypothetical protein
MAWLDDHRPDLDARAYVDLLIAFGRGVHRRHDVYRLPLTPQEDT